MNVFNKNLQMNHAICNFHNKITLNDNVNKVVLFGT